MANNDLIELENLIGDVDGMSRGHYPSAAAVNVQRTKKKRVVGNMTVNARANARTGMDLEYAGLNGYVYSLKYHDGRVKMSVDCQADSGFGDDVGRGGSMSASAFGCLLRS